MEVGIPPVIEFVSRAKLSKLVRFPIEDGRVPLTLQFWINKSTKLA